MDNTDGPDAGSEPDPSITVGAPGNLDDKYITNCSVVVRQQTDGSYKWFMLYEATASAASGGCTICWQLLMATSNDGLTWTKYNDAGASKHYAVQGGNCCDVSNLGTAWDSDVAANGDLFWVNNGNGGGRWVVFYCGYDYVAGGQERVGFLVVRLALVVVVLEQPALLGANAGEQVVNTLMDAVRHCSFNSGSVGSRHLSVCAIIGAVGPMTFQLSARPATHPIKFRPVR